MAKDIPFMMREMDFQWMKLNGLKCICSETIHPGLTCLQELLVKFQGTLKSISKFYIIFHLIPYILKVKKLYSEGRLVKGSFKLIRNFLGSLVFMLHLVCGLKIALCTFSNLDLQIGANTFALGGFLTGISILWQSSSRRQEIAYYAFVRSLRAAYVFLRRRSFINAAITSQMFIIILFGALKKPKFKVFQYVQSFMGSIVKIITLIVASFLRQSIYPEVLMKKYEFESCNTMFKILLIYPVFVLNQFKLQGQTIFSLK